MKKIPVDLKEQLKNIPDRRVENRFPDVRLRSAAIFLAVAFILFAQRGHSNGKGLLLMPSDGDVVVERVAVVSDRNIRVWVDGEELTAEDMDGIKLFEVYLPPGTYSIKVMDGRKIKEAVVYVIGASTADRS